jgi:hypothetical protein
MPRATDGYARRRSTATFWQMMMGEPQLLHHYNKPVGILARLPRDRGELNALLDKLLSWSGLPATVTVNWEEAEDVPPDGEPVPIDYAAAEEPETVAVAGSTVGEPYDPFSMIVR